MEIVKTWAYTEILQLHSLRNKEIIVFVRIPYKSRDKNTYPWWNRIPYSVQKYVKSNALFATQNFSDKTSTLLYRFRNVLYVYDPQDKRGTILLNEDLLLKKEIASKNLYGPVGIIP